MSYVKKTEGCYRDENDVRNVVNYISDMEKSIHLVGGGLGVIGAEEIQSCPEFIADQILTVQHYKGCRGRRLYHVVVSFDNVLDGLDIREIKRVADRIVYLYRGYQSVYALHENTQHMHLHILFNNIPLEDGKNLTSYFNVTKIHELVEQMVGEYKYNRKL